MIENTSLAFIDLAQDETGVASRSRVGIHRRKLRTLGHVIAQESFLSSTVVRGLHPSPVTFENSVTLRYLIWRGNNDEDKLNLVVIGRKLVFKIQIKRFNVEESSLSCTFCFWWSLACLVCEPGKNALSPSCGLIPGVLIPKEGKDS